MDHQQQIPHPTTDAAMPPRSEHPQQPPLPPRQSQTDDVQAYHPADYAGQQVNTTQNFPPPPKRTSVDRSGGETIGSPIHYTRDPHNLVAYLVPFPKPKLHNVPADAIPERFLIYTPPPPPLSKPAEGEKEIKVHKVQRKWQEEIREAKMSDAKTMSWKGIKGRVTKGINWGMSQTKSSNLEFLNRIGANPQQEAEAHDAHADDGKHEEPQTKATVKLEEMLLVYPASMPGTTDQIKQEFVNTMLRSKSQAERDAVLATGLLPVAAAIDILATLVWPFGGLLEVDAVWAYASIRGAKASRSVTKRLTSSSSASGTTGRHEGEEDKLRLEFTPSPRLRALERFLAARCHERDAKLYPFVNAAPTETEVLEAIGWFPSAKGGEEKNWEDEQWEIAEVKDDLRAVSLSNSRYVPCGRW